MAVYNEDGYTGFFVFLSNIFKCYSARL